ILERDLEAVPGLVCVLNPDSPKLSSTAITLLYSIFRHSSKRTENEMELVSVFSPYVDIFASLFVNRWVNGWPAGRLAYMIAVLDKRYLVPSGTPLLKPSTN